MKWLHKENSQVMDTGILQGRCCGKKMRGEGSKRTGRQGDTGVNTRIITKVRKEQMREVNMTVTQRKMRLSK